MTRGRPRTTEHGITLYKHGCRCEVCVGANRVASARKRRRMLGSEPPNHGLSGYKNYGCRCEVCFKASSDFALKWYADNQERILVEKRAKDARQREANNAKDPQ